MILQLNPPIPVIALGKGEGRAIGWIDYGPEISLIWVVAIEKTNEIWCLKNEEIRTHKNFTMDYCHGMTDTRPGAEKRD